MNRAPKRRHDRAASAWPAFPQPGPNRETFIRIVVSVIAEAYVDGKRVARATARAAASSQIPAIGSGTALPRLTTGGPPSIAARAHEGGKAGSLLTAPAYAVAAVQS